MCDVNVTEPAVLIRIPRLFMEGMSPQALYEATRGVWRISDRREGARYALAVANGVVREVYVIDRWHPAATTEYETRLPQEVNKRGRWEFTGRVAPATVRDKYLGCTVAHYFRRGNANPITYVNT